MKSPTTFIPNLPELNPPYDSRSEFQGVAFRVLLLAKQANLPMGEAMAFLMVAASPTPVTQTLMVEALKMTRTQVSQQFRALEAKHLIYCVYEQKVTKFYRLTLTGQTLYQRFQFVTSNAKDNLPS
jgi:DNA-binding MarR family transcriptional regulator